MASNIRSKNELTPFSPPSPKLSMKYLHELIKELRQENHMLSNRLDEIEEQLTEYRMLLAEAASAAEHTVADRPLSIATHTEQETNPDVPEYIRMTRSERHYAPRRKLFGFF